MGYCGIVLPFHSPADGAHMAWYGDLPPKSDRGRPDLQQTIVALILDLLCLCHFKHHHVRLLFHRTPAAEDVLYRASGDPVAELDRGGHLRGHTVQGSRSARKGLTHVARHFGQRSVVRVQRAR